MPLNREKRRIHIVLSLDNPLQRETWRILSQAKNKTSAVCEAVCGYQKQKGLEDNPAHRYPGRIEAHSGSTTNGKRQQY